MKPSKLLFLICRSHVISENLDWRFMFRGFALLFALLISTKSIAENEPVWAIQGVQALALLVSDTIEVRVFDSVTDGCMPSPDAIKQAALVQLRRNNFKVGENSGLNVGYLEIDTIGFASNSRSGNQLGCAVFVNIEFRTYVRGFPNAPWNQASVQDFGIFSNDISLGGTLFQTRYASEMQDDIVEVVQKAVDSLFLRTKRAEDLLEDKFPDAARKFGIK